jgi:hypothetical protein
MIVLLCMVHHREHREKRPSVIPVPLSDGTLFLVPVRFLLPMFLPRTLKNPVTLPIISGDKPVILRAERFQRKGRKPTVPFKEER